MQAAQDFDLDLSRSYFIGDTLGDMQAGHTAGCHPILVQTGYGNTVWQEWSETFMPEHLAADLQDAIKRILQ